MARDFNGTTDLVNFKVGAMSGMTHGTWVVIARVTDTGLSRTLLGYNTSGGTFIVTPLQMRGDDLMSYDSDGGYGTTIPQGVWLLYVCRKPTGTTNARLSRYRFDTGAWQHDLSVSAHADFTIGATDLLGVHTGSGSELWDGAIEVMAAWKNFIPFSADAWGDKLVEENLLQFARHAFYNLVTKPSPEFVGVGARGAGTTTTTPTYPTNGNVAGNLAVALRSIKPSTATATAESGWTSLINVTGGTGTQGIDTGPQRLSVDYREEAGGAGTPSFDQASSPNSVTSALFCYSKASGATWDVVGTSGDDATHGSGRSATGGSIDMKPGDIILLLASSDTDNVGSYSSPTLTATGFTFTTPVMRQDQGGSTTGQDVGSWAYEAKVLTGSGSAAPTFTVSGGPAANSCGPIAFVRIRVNGATAVPPPDWMVEFNQAQAGQSIADITGGGGNLDSIAGTTIIDGPPGFGWGADPIFLRGHAAAGGATITPAGTVTPAGTLTKQVTTVKSGTTTPAGATSKQGNKALSGSATPSGTLSLVRLAVLSLAGTVTPAGTLLRQVNLLKAGTTTPTGSSVKQAQKSLSGSTTPGGSLAKQVQKALAGLLGTKAFYHPHSVAVGMTTPDVAAFNITDLDYEVRLRMEDWAAPGQVTIIGGQTAILGDHAWALSINTNGDIGCGTSPDGATGAQITVTEPNPGFASGSTHTIRVTADVNDGAGGKVYRLYIDGTLVQEDATAGTTSIFNSTSALTTSNPVLAIRGGHVYWAKLRDSIGGNEIANPTATEETLGATSFADAAGRTWTFGTGGYVGTDLYGKLTATRVLLRSFAGTVTPVGSLVRAATKALVGTVTPAGALAKTDQKPLAGTTTPTGSLRKLVGKLLGGSVTPVGTLSTTAGLILRSFAGAITPVGAVLKRANKSLGGGSTPAGALVRTTQKSLSGNAAPAGTLRKAATKLLSGGITPSGALATLRLIVKTLGGIVTPTGTLQRQSQKVTGGTVTPSGSVTRVVGKGLGGTITPTGTVAKIVAKIFGGLIAAIGTLFTEIPSGIPLQLKLGSLRRRFDVGDPERHYDAGDMARRYGTDDLTREP